MYQMASMVRDRISIDSWRILYRIEQDFRRPSLARELVQPGDLLAVLNQVLINLSAFSGLGMESMTRDAGLAVPGHGPPHRAVAAHAAPLRSTLVVPTDSETAVMEAVLEIADSLMTYRSRYLSTLQPAPVLDLLLSDETNPRSIGFQLAALSDHVEGLPRDQSIPGRSRSSGWASRP